MSRKIVIGENLSYKKITCKYIPDKYINASDFLLNADSGYSYIGGEYNYPKFRIYYRYYDRALKEDVFVDIYTYDVSTEEVYNIENFTLPSDFGIVESINTSSPLYKYIRVDETSGTNEEKFTKKIEVLNKFGQTLAIFTNEDDDIREKIIDPYVTLTQNADNILTFSVPENSKKWNEIKNIENLYKVDGRIYSPLFSDSYTRVTAEDNQNLIQIKAYERQKLLEKKYVTAWNSTTGFAKIDNFMVVIVSKGNLALTNNYENVDTQGFQIGTAGYILTGLLHGTGWTVGIVDVEGVYDFETEQLTVYENVLKVQEMFGGILIFDSNNQIVHLRDEANYQSYKGYEIRTKKNMKNKEEIIDNALITKLYVLGEAGLNIASVNNDKIYIEDYTYSNETYEKIVTNTDIYEPEQLLKWGKRQLKDLCRQRKTVTTNMTYLSQKKGYENEVLDLNDTVDVVELEEPNENGQELVKSVEQLRVISWGYPVFEPINSILELGDTTRNTTDIFKKISNTTNAYSTGNIDADLVRNFNTGNTVTQDFEIQREQNIEFQTNYEGLGLSISNVANKVDAEGNRISTVESQINDITLTTSGLTQSLQSQGGSNLLLNSSALFNGDYWRGNVLSYTNTEIQQEYLSDNCFLLQNDTIGQNISVPNGDYYIGFRYKKILPLASCQFKINGVAIELSETEIFTDVDYTINVTDHNIKIEMVSDTNNACYVGDIIVTPGSKKVWSPNPNETFTDNVKIGKYLEISSNTANTKLKADTDGVRIMERVTSEVKTEFTDKGTITDELTANTSKIAGLLIQQQEDQTWISSLL